MADIHIKRAHSLTREEARARVQNAADKLKDQYPVKTEWKGQDHLAFTATGVKGGIEIKDNEVEVKVELGFLARALKGRIEEGINKSLDRELTKTA